MSNTTTDTQRNANAANAVAIVAGFMGVFAIWATSWLVVLKCLVSAFIIGSIAVLAVIQDERQLSKLTEWIGEGGLGWGYRRLIGRTLSRLWYQYCRPAPASVGPVRTFAAAFSWRLYDLALFMAVTYPILAMIFVWLITGQPSGFDEDPFLHALEVGSGLHVAALLLGAIWLAVIFLTLRERVPKDFDVAQTKNEPWSIGEKLGYPLLAICTVLIWLNMFTLTIQQLLQGAATVLGVVLVSRVGRVGAPVGNTGSYFVFSSLLVSAFVLAGRTGTVSLNGGLQYALGIAMALTLVGSIAGLRVLALSQGRWIVPLTTTMIAPFLIVFVAINYHWWNVTDRSVAIFLFFMVLPMLNAAFDVVSYAVTISLVRLGLRAKRIPGAVFGLADLCIAAILFFLLGVAIVLVVAGLNAISQVPIVNLGRILARIEQGPSAETAWIYVMVCSTLLPTIVHFGLALLSVERVILPVAAPYNQLLGRARDSVLHGGLASLCGGLVLALPVGVIWLLGWAAYWLMEDLIEFYGHAYVKILLHLSEAIGAF